MIMFSGQIVSGSFFMTCLKPSLLISLRAFFSGTRGTVPIGLITVHLQKPPNHFVCLNTRPDNIHPTGTPTAPREYPQVLYSSCRSVVPGAMIAARTPLPQQVISGKVPAGHEQDLVE